MFLEQTYLTTYGIHDIVADNEDDIIYPYFQRPLFLPCFKKTKPINKAPKILQITMPHFCNFNLKLFYLSYWKKKKII